MKIKFKILALSLNSLILLSSFKLCALDSENFDDLFNPDVDQVSSPQQSTSDLDCLTDLEILQLITPDPGETCDPDQDTCPSSNCIINVPAILKENLYLRTTGPITKRSLLDEPALRSYGCDICGWLLTAQLFYNYTPRVFFTENSPFIESYIDLTNQNIVNEVSSALDIAGCSDINIPDVLGLFRNIKLQQHRAGIMLGASKTFNCLNLSFRIPIYYLVEHFYLTDEEIDRISNAPFFTSLEEFGATSDKEKSEEFGKQHLVSDKVGFGDSRLNALFKIYEVPTTRAWFGFQATFPTAKTFKSGLIGANFNPCALPPEFNIRKLFELYICPSSPEAIRQANMKITEISTDFLVGTLDRLSTILFNAPLGNGGHFGGGPQFDLLHEMNSCWSMHTFAAYEVFSKNCENRFFLTKKDPSSFDRNFRDEDNATENLTFLNAQIIDTLYPTRLTIGVRPGAITKASQSFIYNSENWHGLVGFDYWHQASDQFYINENLINSFNINKGLRPAAHQGKVFLNFGYRDRAFCNTVLWDVEFLLDATVFHKGIGENFTLGLRAHVNF